MITDDPAQETFSNRNTMVNEDTNMTSLTEVLKGGVLLSHQSPETDIAAQRPGS